MAKTKKSLKKAQWERGYSSHGYWLGKEKLGEVRLAPLLALGLARIGADRRP